MSWLGRLSDLTSLSKLGIGMLSPSPHLANWVLVCCHKVDVTR